MDLQLSDAGQQTVQALLQAARDSWPGTYGERRAADMRALLERVLPEYSRVLGISQDDVLGALERRRDYCAVNYYQDSRLPTLTKVTLFETLDDFKAAAGKSEYRCPSCEGISTDPYACNSGLDMEAGKTCDWKSYGLFGTLGKGLRVVVKDEFLNHPGVHEIFMPVALENQ